MVIIAFYFYSIGGQSDDIVEKSVEQSMYYV